MSGRKMSPKPETMAVTLSQVRSMPVEERLKTLLDMAQVAPGFSAYYLGVSRQTVSNWVRGIHAIDEHNLPAVNRMVDALTLCLLDVSLPLALTRPRHDALVRALRSVDTGLQVAAHLAATIASEQ
jgi:hypothetical protein